jgi:fluoroquinolone transport system permease protein
MTPAGDPVGGIGGIGGIGQPTSALVAARAGLHRMRATMACDMRVQYRNGFYLAAAFVAVFWILILRLLPIDDLAWWMPVFVLSNALIGTFYFIAGLVLLEKSEGTLLAQAVAPLRDGEYLGSKVATLLLLALVENLAIVALAIGPAFRPLPLVAGLSSAAAFLVLVGFLVVVRYDSINEYLFPSFLFTLIFIPPALAYLGIWQSPLAYLHPLQAALVLMSGAVAPLEAWQRCA